MLLKAPPGPTVAGIPAWRLPSGPSVIPPAVSMSFCNCLETMTSSASPMCAAFPALESIRTLGRTHCRPRCKNTASPTSGFKPWEAVADREPIHPIPPGATSPFVVMPTTWPRLLFGAALHELLALAEKKRTALMCAEAVWWRCHRSMIADKLCVLGVRVVHILDDSHETVHPMTSPARVVEGRLTYVPEGP